MEFTEDILLQVLNLRDQKRISYADLAEQFYGKRELGDSLRSAIRAYKRKHQIHTILDPVGKLFGETQIIPEKPTLIIGDTHAPYQNKKVLIEAFTLARKRHIKQLVHAGDLIDAASYNSQAKGEQTTPIETDIAHARSILYTAHSYGFELWIVPGNHDIYYTKKTDISFSKFICEKILDNRYVNRTHTTEYDYMYYGDFAIIGHLSSGYDPIPGKVAANIADKYERHALVGHDHLFGYMKGQKGYYGISIGGMFVPDSFWYKSRSYNTFPMSMIGFCIIQDGKIHMFDSYLNETILEPENDTKRYIPNPR